ncbi:hypothetical protein E2562_036833 [Oryza meyeriana var. granulata]|uniref:Uncharacterized protein n=1 Tax=Oryza meyeriana var. granulata TaxID=110450 RepID=A0A6G1E7K4_9ORYZ|nr:hypothetical protein E2562_036833 [Oryza meyeriana var. granulata]
MNKKKYRWKDRKRTTKKGATPDLRWPCGLWLRKATQTLRQQSKSDFDCKSTRVSYHDGARVGNKEDGTQAGGTS